MKKSKVDRIAELARKAAREAMEDLILSEFRAGRANKAAILEEFANTIAFRVEGNLAFDTYRRLEVSDIIRGHKRAWPES